MAIVADGNATIERGRRFASPDGRYVLGMHGDVDNIAALQRDLGARGSEAEVLLAGFAAWGPHLFRRLIGSYACAVLDTRDRRLTLARDHFGTKSLFYARTPTGIAFASSIPVLLPYVTARTVDPQRLRDYLDQGLTDHGSATLFSAIRQIPAAHYVVVELDRPGQVDPVDYWRPHTSDELAASYPEAAARLGALLQDAIGHQSRGRTGALLSGGTDTSAIVMLLRRWLGPSADLHTFSYIGDDGAISEAAWIDIVNAAAHAIPHKMGLRWEEWNADFDDLIGLQGEPFGTIAVSAQHRLYQLAAAAGVDVVLAGGGADELLGGHLFARLASLLRRGAWGAAIRLARRSPSPWRNLARGIAMTLPARAVTAAAKIARRRLRPWIDWDWLAKHGVEIAEPWWMTPDEPRMLRALLWRTVRTGLAAILRYEDRNATAAGVAARFPFLTPALAELVFSLPEEYLISDDGRSKAVLRSALRDVVPEAVLERRQKVGFSVPLQSWTIKIPAVAGLLDASRGIPGVDPRGVAPILAALRAHRPLSLRDSFITWRLVGLAAWSRRFNVTFA